MHVYYNHVDTKCHFKLPGCLQQNWKPYSLFSILSRLCIDDTKFNRMISYSEFVFSLPLCCVPMNTAMFYLTITTEYKQFMFQYIKVITQQIANSSYRRIILIS